MGDQEFEITKAVECMTKYCEMVTDKNRIRYCLEKALKLSQQGRPGPCWLDIPMNVQGAYIETDELIGYSGADDETLPCPVSNETADKVLDLIAESERPVFNVGNGVRIAGAHEVFYRVANKASGLFYWQIYGLDVDSINSSAYRNGL